MTRDDLFNTNATIVATLTAACAQHCPEEISDPVTLGIHLEGGAFLTISHGTWGLISLLQITDW